VNLIPFCSDKDDAREYFHIPFNLGGCTFATNGSVTLRVKLDPKYLPFKGTSEFSRNELPTKLLDFFKNIENFDFKVLPRLAKLNTKECAGCDGVGLKIKEDCEECEGEGDLIFSNSYNQYEVECQSCLGKGKKKIEAPCITCHVCDGDKQVIDHENNFHRLPEGDVSAVILHSLNKLAGFRYAHKEGLMYVFKFNGDYGLFMGINGE